MVKYLVPILVLSFSLSLTLYNIGNFPKMIGDEGIYVAQAHHLAKYAELGPYTYWYDHFPLGWVQISLWQLLTDPLGWMGYSVLSARLFMAIILSGTSILIYFLTKHLTKSILMALFGAIIFSTSYLTLTFGRMVLLDNLAIFWFLLSLSTFLTNPHKLKNLTFSAIFISISILTKETLLFLLPPYIYAIYRLNQDNPHKRYSLLLNFTTIIFLLSFFPLLAILKGELIPRPGQVSFMETILFQASRGSGIPFYQAGSHFREMLSVWLSIDPIYLLLGIGTFLLIPVMNLPHTHKLFSYYLLFFTLFLIRGGQIYEFYIIPALPLFAINIALLINHFNRLTNTIITPFVIITTIALYVYSTSLYPFTAHSTQPQKESIDELISLPEGSTIIANNYTYLDVLLRSSHTIHWYQKIESDQAIQRSSPPITHILTDIQFEQELSSGQLPYLHSLTSKAKLNSTYGPLLAPGEVPHPFSTESLNLYMTSPETNEPIVVITPTQIDRESLEALVNKPPGAILVTSSHFSSSLDLQNKITIIRTVLPYWLILTTQDGEGNNTIPWIPTLSRNFYKSSQEASDATHVKSLALKQLGFDGAIITKGHNDDGYLPDIMEASNKIFLGLIPYESDIFLNSGNFLISNTTNLLDLETARFQGKIFLLEQTN